MDKLMRYSYYVGLIRVGFVGFLLNFSMGFIYLVDCLLFGLQQQPIFINTYYITATNTTTTASPGGG